MPLCSKEYGHANVDISPVFVRLCNMGASWGIRLKIAGMRDVVIGGKRVSSYERAFEKERTTISSSWFGQVVREHLLC